ncbi:polysaccharide biosynthesis protein CapD [Treponema primitia ZAS-2]|uniref:Polysaccharide biosynthesis protein CapD n=1 Tax=Treponema primitia (strain ATCC BAA-887 / DSM 12427 / ZAS-2) TaxID=545694 RepID=F5YN28_TREPZ|nr:UDP-N-acetylglucosamine 4,6-dehydratase [Treponema primitia]AEF86950.1 polysaccharide biosynthesis protein CapD [Treponema primitia ZAS-2]
MFSILSLIGRSEPLFLQDIMAHEPEVSTIVASSRFLVIGGAGSIGSAVIREIFKRNPKLLHVVDISENNLVELVRDIRSSLGYIKGDFTTFAIDCGSDIFDAFIKNGQGYDYILNLSALKHVRSEKEPYTLMRMIDVNIFNTDKNIQQAKEIESKKYFCVSTDKAANPVNMMGASKRIMEMFLMRRSLELPVSTARFANVAFSDGSLLYGFNRRIEKEQPLSAPNDVRRYFITPQEAGELCLMSCLLGENRDIFFPKLDNNLNLITFSEIAGRYLENIGYEPVQCSTEEEARQRVTEFKKQKKYPVFFFKSDTTGEKYFEEFYTEKEILDMDRFKSIGIIENAPIYDDHKLNMFSEEISVWRRRGTWSRLELIDLFNQMIPEFNHQETGKFLDGRM